jgi:hypothetical protein
MAYYTANTVTDTVLCDECGDARWETHPKYGTNVDSRLDEAERTGVRWSWTPIWGGTECATCSGHVK